ncbi:alpha-amylase family glycosyl hydrolase [Devosia sp. YIM 151766]|uniref:alpha-amylase family glycosyl hydrolase n=1 Tax=Devosia sp. YIM 151766 TaxID=3017325 RepID=UPI00255C7CE7|nr:alpha-amylase family glycosyl hydrolase [Devosia sp. YIM 151766]WIY53573.1 alpha-amylase family glycosyl hydrolase [Devosia sp. YIM 151766]
MPASDFLGATPHGAGTRFALWASGRRSASVEIEDFGSFEMAAAGDGFFRLDIADVGPGARYWFRIDGGPRLPDLASRWQPEGNDGPSVVMTNDFTWTDGDWRGIGRFDQVLYELHIGTFTQAGTWTAAAERLDALREVGVTVLQLMPVGTFKGRFGWGYDTTLPYAPFAPYGSPDEMRAFVDRAHALGIGVILDVVYNHAGPGDHYRAYSEHYFSDRYENEWGPSFNFDGEKGQAVRDFTIGNAVYWIEDFHLDGLRIDAAQALFDASDSHVISEIARAVRAAAGARDAYVIVENQPQEHVMIAPPDQGGYGLDAMVNDDFQHAARVAITGHNDFYYRDYLGTPQELVSALKYGFLYQGQRSNMRDKPYGTYNLATPPEHFVHFLENHDQIANSARGFRLSALASPARLRAITSLLLLGPQTPSLFQGQEFAASNPFLYFMGLEGDEARAVADGRRQSLTNFPSVTDPEMQARLPDPSDVASFETSKLDWGEAERHAGMLALHRDLLALRRRDATFSQATERRIDGAVIGDAALLLRYITPDPAGHRLLLLNLGKDLQIGVVAEPLLAPADGHQWALAWSSEHPDYDGAGRRPLDPEHFWILPGDCAVLLRSKPRS